MATSDVKISLIRNNPPGLDKVRGRWVNLNEEYVEIENSSNEDANISGWTLADVYEFKDMKRRHEFVFPLGTKVRANSILKIMTGNGKNDFENQKFYWNWPSAIWNNPGDVAVLYDENLQIMDFQGVGNKIFGTVKGFVRDAETDKGIKDADVSGETGLMPARTDDKGKYILQLVAAPNGVDRKVTAAKDDKYASQTHSVTIYPNKTSDLDFGLSEGGGGAILIDLSVNDRKLIMNKIVNGQLWSAELQNWKVPWGTDYDIKIIYQNNKSPITTFQSYIYESQDKNSFPANHTTEFGLPERKGSFVNDEIAALYDIPEKDWGNWKWYHVGKWYENGGYAVKDNNRRRYYYKLKYYGKRGNLPPNAEQNAKEEILPRNVLVYVSDEKLEAFNTYNAMVSWGWVAVILTIVAIGSGVGAGLIAVGAFTIIISKTLLELFLAVLGIGTESASIGAKLWSDDIKKASEKVMQDPPKFVKNYKAISKPTKSNTTHKRNLPKIMHTISANINALVETNNKIYSCAVCRDKVWAKKHLATKTEIKRELKSGINNLHKLYIHNKKILGKVKFDRSKLHLAIRKIKKDTKLKKKLSKFGVKYSAVLVLDKLLQKNVIRVNDLKPAKIIYDTIKSLRNLYARL